MMKNTWKRMTVFALVLVLAISTLTACGGGGNTGSTTPGGSESSKSNDVLTIQLAHADVENETGIHHKMSLLFRQYVDELSDGTIQIEIVGGGQLGGERDLVEGMQLGTIEMASTANMVLSNFMPEFAVLDLPYMFGDYAAAYKVLDSDAIAEVIEKFASEQGVRILAYHNGGFRQTAGNKAINSLADFSGMKIRVPESDIYSDTFNALGASPVPLAYTDTFTALQQKTVDAFEIAAAVILSNNFYEVCSDLSITNHLFSPSPFMISESLYQSLTEEQKAVLDEAAEKAAADQRTWMEANDETLINQLEENGMTINRPDVAELQIAVQNSGLYEKYRDIVGSDLLDSVMQLAS